MARKFLLDNDFRYRPWSDGQPIVRRVISINTPYHGSGLAEYLANEKNNFIDRITIKIIGFGLSIMENKKVHVDGKLIPALVDLVPESDLLNKLNANGNNISTPTVAIAGDIGEYIIDAKIDWLASLLLPSHHELFNGLASDGIVSISSQINGFPGKLYPGAEYNHTNILDLSSIGSAVVTLLTSPLSEFNRPDLLLKGQSLETIEHKKITSSAFTLSHKEIYDGISIDIANLPATAIPGEKILIKAIIQNSSGKNVDIGNVFLRYKNKIALQMAHISNNEYEVLLEIPHTDSGNQELSVLAMDREGYAIAYSKQHSMLIKPDANVVMMSFNVSKNMIIVEGFSREVWTLAVFDDGYDRKIDGPEVGTTYISENSKIATVDAYGKITGIAVGETQIKIINGDVAEIINVKVIKTDVEEQLEQEKTNHSSGGSGGCATGIGIGIALLVLIIPSLKRHFWS